jgi:hypothetical protein
MAARKVNCSVGVSLHRAKYIFEEKIWYCPSDMFDEIRDVKDHIRVIFFTTEREVSDEQTERQVLGYYLYPDHKGKAVFDSISRSFVHSDTGSHDVVSGEDGEVVRFYRYVKLPYLDIKRGHRVWLFENSDAIKILQVAQEMYLRSKDSQRVQGIVSSIQTVLSDIEEKEDLISPDVSQEYETLSSWLRERLDECQVSELPTTREFVRKLIARAQEKRNPIYYLQAAKLQAQYGDYKFVITLANYCLSLGFEALDDKRWDDAFDSFLEAARLYQQDPMITETGWKREQRLRSLRLAIQAATSSALESHKYSLSETTCLDAVERKTIEALKKQLPSHQIKEFIRGSYYAQMATHLLDTNQQSEFLQFYEDAPEIEFPQWMTLRYYREKAKEFERKGHARPEDFIQAAEYRKRAADLLAQSEGDESMDYREEMVDYHKCFALAHANKGEIVDFEFHMDKAIKLAEGVKDEPEATELHHENFHFLTGMKYGKLARHEADPEASARYHTLASEAYSQVESTVARGRSAFHQLMSYQSLVRLKLGKAPEDFEQAALVCREALAKLWDEGGVEALRGIDVLTYRALFESLCLLTADHLSAERWYRANRFHERVQAESLEESARQVWNLVYGTRLIEASGVTLGEVVTRLRAAVRSAIYQLLERKTISETELYDDLVAVQLEDEQQDRKKRILSLLRQRRLSTEGLEIECKEFLYRPSYESQRIISSLHEAVICFLNSPNGGQVIIGVEDDTFNIKGIGRDLQRFGESEAELKDAIMNHIRSKVQAGLTLPNITVSFESVEVDKRVIYIDVPPGDYMGSLYKNNKGVAFIRMDGSKRTISNALEQDELAQQRRESKGPWAVRD